MTTEPVSIPAPKPIADLAEALNDLGRHAALMDQRDEALHDECFYCETMKLFSRVSDFGAQIRKAEKRARS